jgi:hypothetical protein
MEVLPLHENLELCALVGLFPAGSSLLLWEAMPARGKARGSKRRALLEAWNQLVPEDRDVCLLAALPGDEEPSEEYLDELGWNFALQRGDQPPRASYPGALAALPHREAAGEAHALPLLPGEQEEPLQGELTAAEACRWLWLRGLACLQLGLLGQSAAAVSAGGTGGPRKLPRRGRQCHEAMMAMRDAQLHPILRHWADGLAQEPELEGLLKG